MEWVTAQPLTSEVDWEQPLTRCVTLNIYEMLTVIEINTYSLRALIRIKWDNEYTIFSALFHFVTDKYFYDNDAKDGRSMRSEVLW